MLGALPQDKAIGNAIRVVAECANRVADSLSELGYDHAGPLYHRILGSAKSDGAFYTNNLSAILLARLAFTEDLIDWSDPDAVAGLRIIDPACGTGTLLMAALQTIKARVADRRGENEMVEGQRNALHKRVVEDVLCGLDINQHGIQLAACNMTLGAPTVDYERMNLVTMPHGPQGDGAPRAGSLEILAAADDASDLRTITAPQRSLETLDAEQVNESEEIQFPLHDLNGVIMNAPFTDNMKRSRKFGPEAIKAMQRHELDIRNRLADRDPEAGAVITTNSIQTFFTPLAEKLLRTEGAFLATVVPVTVCTGAAALPQRRFLAERFHIERIVTTHDPRRIAFSENTSIHESLLICRRRPRGDRPPTEFVSLRKMPDTPDEAIEIAEAVAAGQAADWGQVCLWPADRVQAGDWTPAQWYDGRLPATIREIERSPLLEHVGLRHDVGPTGRRIRDTYRKCKAGDEGAVRLFWSISSKLRRSMCGEPEDWRCPKSGKEDLARQYWEARSAVLVAARMNSVSGRLTALWTRSPSVGSGWTPVAISDEHRAKALTAWWNSTPARLMLLNQRSKLLTYAAWSLAQLQVIRVPKPTNRAWDTLAEAWNQVRDLELLPMRLAEDCEARRIIDAASAVALGIGDDEIAGWRRRLAAEPTIANVRAAIPGRE